MFQANYPATVSSALVEFDSGARSNWHTHPMGQTLIVTEGSGRVQEWGKEIKVIQKGDVIWTPPGIKHWHGGGVNSRMSHIAVQEGLDGKSVQWLETVENKKPER